MQFKIDENLPIEIKAEFVAKIMNYKKEAEQKLSTLSEKEQLELLAKKFKHLRKAKKVVHVA